jgi:flagellar basal-body rod protein FlgF
LDSGYYAACTALKTQANALEIAANNIANVNTTGYRGQTPSFRSMLVASSATRQGRWNRLVNEFAVLDGVRLDMARGNLEHTGNPLDLALEGPGFFAVQTTAGTLYARNGTFRISASRQLVTSAGDPVLGYSGPINLPGGDISISSDGTISVGGGVAGKLRVVSFDAKTQLIAAGGSYYSAPAAGTLLAANSLGHQRMVRQGMLESIGNTETDEFSLLNGQSKTAWQGRSLAAMLPSVVHPKDCSSA